MHRNWRRKEVPHILLMESISFGKSHQFPRCCRFGRHASAIFPAVKNWGEKEATSWLQQIDAHTIQGTILTDARHASVKRLDGMLIPCCRLNSRRERKENRFSPASSMYTRKHSKDGRRHTKAVKANPEPADHKL